jgi:hypothetical protein
LPLGDRLTKSRIKNLLFFGHRQRLRWPGHQSSQVISDTCGRIVL